MKLLPSFAAGLAIMCTAHGYATVVVDATGATPGSVTTINAALAGTDPDIMVKNTGVYEESLLIQKNVTIRGEDPANRPIIAVNQLPSQPSCLGAGGAERDGIYIGTSETSGNVSVTLQNLIVIPTVTGTKPSDDAITGTAHPGNTVNLTIDNLLIAPNNGSNQPVATDVWADPNLAGTTRINDDGIFFADDEFYGLAGLTSHNYKDLTIIGVGGDGIVQVNGPGVSNNTFERVNISYAVRYGMQLSEGTANYSFIGTHDAPSTIIRKCTGGTAIGLALVRAGTALVDNAVILDARLGMRADWDTVNMLTITNSLFAGNSADGLWTQYAAAAPKLWLVSNCTFFANGGGVAPSVKAENQTTANSTFIFMDSVFAGTGTYAVENRGAASITLNNCALVTAGPDALLAVLGPGNTGSVLETNTVNADPQFASTAFAPVVATSFDVANPAYATANSTGGPLNGWGDGPGSAVRDWSVY